MSAYLPRGLVVSCQARPGSPLRGPAFMAAMATAAVAGGAVAIRAEGVEDLRAIRARVRVPLVGLIKRGRSRLRPYITPDLLTARGVADAGADLIAVDATDRERPGGPVESFLPAVARTTRKAVWADVATVAEGEAAARAGAAVVATTLAGYVGPGEAPEGPDLALVEALAKALDVPVVAEGRYATPEQVAEAFRLGAHAVVVGTAITDPVALTERFAAAVPARGGSAG